MQSVNVFIESLRASILLRIFTPEEMSFFDSIDEDIRCREMLLQGLVDCEKVGKQLGVILKHDLTTAMLEGSCTLHKKIQQVREELIEKIVHSNKLPPCTFSTREKVGDLVIQTDDNGNLIIGGLGE